VLVEDLIREYKLGEADLAKIEQEGYIRIQGGKISFTDTGQKVATRIIRCHRLAERLLDVLDISDKNQEEAACDFEHTVPPEVAEAICTLLGHPTQCPHGKEIPPGECCKRAEMEVKRIVVSLPELNAGERGKIVYISTKDHSRMDKLTSFGFFPGTLVKVHQTRPAFVLSNWPNYNRH